MKKRMIQCLMFPALLAMATNLMAQGIVGRHLLVTVIDHLDVEQPAQHNHHKQQNNCLQCPHPHIALSRLRHTVLDTCVVKILAVKYTSNTVTVLLISTRNSVNRK